MKRKALILILTITLVFGLSAAATAATADTATAKPTAATVLVNGKKVAFDAYNINGNNYFKLRDLAKTLSGSAKQFEVGWDDENDAISLTSGKPYTSVGGEMAGKGAGDKTATPTSSIIYLDDKETRFTAYNIQGNNYFKLRDIGKAFDFGVDWDAAKNTIVIDTAKGYTPEPLIMPNLNEVIGTVNGENIYRYEYEYYLNSYFNEYFSNYYDSLIQYEGVNLLDEEGSREFLGDLENFAWNNTIQAALIRQIAAKEYNVSLEPSYYESLLLADTVLSLNTNRLYALIYPLIEAEAGAAKGMDAAEAKGYYEQDPTVWDCRKVAHIIITAEQMAEEAWEKEQDLDYEQAMAAAKKRAEDIIARLAKGEDYAKLAAEFSGDGTAQVGGEMDIYFNASGSFINEDGSFDPLFVEGAFLLKNVGDTSKTPVESSFGYHIIKLLDKKEGFEAVKEYILNMLLNVDSNDVGEYFSIKMQELQDNAVIKRNFEFKYYVESSQL